MRLRFNKEIKIERYTVFGCGCTVGALGGVTQVYKRISSTHFIIRILINRKLNPGAIVSLAKPRSMGHISMHRPSDFGCAMTSLGEFDIMISVNINETVL